MKWLIPTILIIAAGLYYQLYYPQNVLEKRTQAALDSFAKSVNLNSRDAVGEALHQLIDEDAIIQLEVNFFTFGQQGAGRSIKQDFTKDEFILFMDSVLYPLTAYGYEAQLEQLILAEDNGSGDVKFISSQWAEGTSFMGGVSLATRFNSTAECEGQAAFYEHQVLLNRARCVVSIRPLVKESPSDIMKKLEGAQ